MTIATLVQVLYTRALLGLSWRLTAVMFFTIITVGYSGRALAEKDSQANRKDQTFSLTYEALGTIYPYFSNQGVALGIYQNPDLIWELTYNNGDFVLNDLISGVSADIELATIRAKMFLGNSFYANLGIGARKFTFIGESSVDDTRIEETITSYGAEFDIGNRWQWDSFTLGCDWVGVFKPFAYEAEQTITGANTDSVLSLDFENTADGIGKANSPHMLRLYFGFSF